MAPIVAELRQAGEKRPIAREEKKRLSKVCEEVGEALRRLNADALDKAGQDAPGEGGKRDTQPGGRRSPTPRGGHREPYKGGSRGTTVNPTEPPPDAVGILMRKLTKITGGSSRPPAILDVLDPSVRSQWREEQGSAKVIVVNVKYPLYEEFSGSEPYLAETLIMQLAQPLQEGEVKTLEEFLAEVNNVIRAWAEVKA